MKKGERKSVIITESSSKELSMEKFSNREKPRRDESRQESEGEAQSAVDQQRSATPREIALNLLNSATLGRKEKKEERKDTHSPPRASNPVASRRDVVVAAGNVDTRTHPDISGSRLHGT